MIFFFKSSIDWADGLLARIKKQTSNLGELLDEWGAYIGSLSFLSGFGVYIFNKENDTFVPSISGDLCLLSSPMIGLSTLMTSAPASDKNKVASGPGRRVEKSKTFTPDKIPFKFFILLI